MSRPAALGWVVGSGICGVCLALSVTLPVNGGQAIMLWVAGGFGGLFAGAAVATNLARRAMGLDPALDEGRFPKAEPQSPFMDHVPDRIGNTMSNF